MNKEKALKYAATVMRQAADYGHPDAITLRNAADWLADRAPMTSCPEAPCREPHEPDGRHYDPACPYSHSHTGHWCGFNCGTAGERADIGHVIRTRY